MERTSNGAPSTFTVTNFATGREWLSPLTGSAVAAFSQLANYFQLLSAITDPSKATDANLIFDDVLGIGSTPRFTAAQGDTSGKLCPKKKCKNRSHKPRHHTPANSSLLTPEAKKRITLSKQKQYGKNDELRHFKSGGIAISSELTANGSTLFFGNPQVPQGFDFGPPGELSPNSWITPRGSVHSPALDPAVVRSGDSEYTIITQEQFCLFPARDAIWEDAANLTLLSDNTVPGGLDHSTILIRNLVTGALDSIVIDIYQGIERKSLELNVRDFAEDGFILMQRFPCNFDDEASVVLKWIATYWGLVPFASIEEFINEFIIGNWWYANQIGIDTKGNIFSFTTPLLDTKPGVEADRTVPQDATANEFFSELVDRPMPVPSDDDYICSGPRLIKNPPCGTIISWNDLWKTTDTSIIGSLTTSVGTEATRSCALYQFIHDRLKEKGKLCFDDIHDAYEVFQLNRNRRVLGGAASVQNQGSDPFPVSLRKYFFKALDAKGRKVGLTKKEIRRVKELLGCSYDGRSFPNVDIQDKIGGSNFDGRWVLSQLWQSVVARNLWNAAVSDDDFRAAASTFLGLAALDTVPTGDWSLADINQSRVSTVGIASSMASLTLTGLKAGDSCFSELPNGNLSTSF